MGCSQVDGHDSLGYVARHGVEGSKGLSLQASSATYPLHDLEQDFSLSVK